MILAGLFYGLTVWALLQYFVLPLLFPLISDKGFPPFWYGVAFGIYGLTLGALLSRRPIRRLTKASKPPEDKTIEEENDWSENDKKGEIMKQRLTSLFLSF